MKKRVLSILTAVIILLAGIPSSAGAAAKSFIDVKEDDWFSDAVAFVTDKGLFSGVTDHEFAPLKPMTRGMFVQVLANITTNYDAAYYKARDSYYEDVHKKNWTSAPVRWASDARIVNGTSSTRFSPERALTREQIALMLFNYAEKSGNPVSYSSAAAETFSDYTSVSSWAKQAVAWAVDNGIINGSNGRLNPRHTATRAQVAQVFMNAESLLVNKTVEIGTPEPTKANIAMLFSRSDALGVGKAALEFDFDQPTYFADASYPDHNYRVIGLKNENEIQNYLSSFLTPQVMDQLLQETEFHEKDGSVYATIPPHGMLMRYNTSSIKIVSGSDAFYIVSMDIYHFVDPIEYEVTVEMTVVFDNGEYKIYGYGAQYQAGNPVAPGEWLPNYLKYKPW